MEDSLTSSKQVTSQLCLVSIYLSRLLLSYPSFKYNFITGNRTSKNAKKHAKTVLDSVAKGEIKDVKDVMGGGYNASLKSKNFLAKQSKRSWLTYTFCRPLYIAGS